jgi:hypothetical protein
LLMDAPPISSSPFDEELEVEGQFAAMHGEQRFGGFDVHVHLPFVVGGAARVDVSMVNGGLEGRRIPEFQRIGRLDVVVAIAQDGRFAGGMEPIAINQWIAGGGNNFDVLEAGAAQALGDEFGGGRDGGLVLGKRANAGDAKEVL